MTREQEKELFAKCWEICGNDRCVCVGSPTNCGNAQMEKIREEMLDKPANK